MEQKVEKMNRFFEEKIAACEQRDRELSEDGRGDEAVFEKVRGNIYDVMRTWLAVGVRISSGNADIVVAQHLFGAVVAVETGRGAAKRRQQPVVAQQQRQADRQQERQHIRVR